MPWSDDLKSIVSTYTSPHALHFRMYSTTENLKAFKRAKALARKIWCREYGERIVDTMSHESHRPLPVNNYGENFGNIRIILSRDVYACDFAYKQQFSRPSGIVVSDVDCGAVGSGFESRCSQSASVQKIMPCRKSNLGRNINKAKSVRRVIEHQTEKERASANEQNRQRMAQIRAMEAVEQRATRLEDARLRVRH
ncbi:hypothetical protein TNCV_3194881 [Trichonephila clavipes]|uniref:Uncharacterized protein n=1 Tax=Trichonephila clavipes TaxID=2585209 RepID=A0A8X6RAR9_TRICX|nr:hypothetical protein TNCV_3194881 [Trichonephila clavipes]